MSMTVRRAEEKDIDNIIRWTDGHLEFPDCFGYPGTAILCAENGEPVMYGIAYPAMVIETFGVKPGTKPRDFVEGEIAITDVFKRMAANVGMTDIIFFAGVGAEPTERLAERRGFKRVPWRVWRMKLEVPNVRESGQGTTAEPTAAGATNAAGSNSEAEGERPL